MVSKLVRGVMIIILLNVYIIKCTSLIYLWPSRMHITNRLLQGSRLTQETCTKLSTFIAKHCNLHANAFITMPNTFCYCLLQCCNNAFYAFNLSTLYSHVVVKPKTLKFSYQSSNFNIPHCFCVSFVNLSLNPHLFC